MGEGQKSKRVAIIVAPGRGSIAAALTLLLAENAVDKQPAGLPESPKPFPATPRKGPT